ncbi:MAG: hypothetical protein KC478_11155 [Bacteriovoracaceae bacterium]|nr:hypothetical protein [Bacteriovoracaceae bacterium]
MAAAIKESSPLTGIIAEECVVIDFGEHEGKSVLEVNDTHPTYYHYLVEQREKGNFAIKRTKDKIFRLYCHSSRYH